jgi:hypothetical protein
MDHCIFRPVSKEQKARERKRRRWQLRRAEEENKALLDLKRKERIEAEKHKASLKFKSSQKLQQASEKMLRELLAEYKINTKCRNIFSVVLKAKFGKKFYQEKRRDKLKVLAAGCALYHAICKQPDPKEALQRFAASMEVDLPRTSDPCRVIVEGLVDYGGTKDERTRNRQFAARDARALRYVVRTGLDPAHVAKPAKGETITKWADREAVYRSQQKSPPGHQQAATRSVSAPSAPNQLPVVSLSRMQYDTFKHWLDYGLLVVTSKDRETPLAVAVARLKHLTAGQAKTQPVKVQAAIRKALQKAPGRSVSKPSKSDGPSKPTEVLVNSDAKPNGLEDLVSPAKSWIAHSKLPPSFRISGGRGHHAREQHRAASLSRNYAARVSECGTSS